MARARKSSTTTRPAKRKSASGKSRARRATASKASSATTNAEGPFVCPECGRSFSRPAALGAHRNRAHGVAGKSAGARSNRTRRGRAATTGIRSKSGTGARSAGGNVDRDQLLRALFPNGVPPREKLIREINRWLDDAERLSRLR